MAWSSSWRLQHLWDDGAGHRRGPRDVVPSQAEALCVSGPSRRRAVRPVDGPLHWKETGIAAPKSVEDYLAALPDERRVVVEELRQAIRAAAPGATELISYQMPAFKSHGQFLVSYASFKNHYSLFPASEAVVEALGDELTPFLSGKGTIRFPAGESLPVNLVSRIVQIRFAENAAAERP